MGPNFEQAAAKTQYIIPAMKFTCNGSIAAWNVAANVPHIGPPRPITLQLWRVQGTDSDTVASYSLATSQSFLVNSSPGTSPTRTVLTFSPSPEMFASSGDVVGFYVHGAPGPHSPLQVLLTDAANVTLYTRSGTTIRPTTTASPLISVVFRESYVIYALPFM